MMTGLSFNATTDNALRTAQMTGASPADVFTVKADRNVRHRKPNEIGKTKRKPHVAYYTGNFEWYTPSKFIESARKVMGKIDLDPASCEFANRTVKAEKYYTKDDDGLSQEWYGNIWLNPPYARGLIDRFVDKLLESDFNQAIVLINNNTETAYCQRLTAYASAIVYPRGRIHFIAQDGMQGKAALQGQAIFYFGNEPQRFVDEFEKYGTAVAPYHKVKPAA